MWLCCSIIKLEQTVSVYQPAREVTSFKCVPSRVPISTLEQQRARSSLGIGEAAPACSGEFLASHFGSKFCHGKKKKSLGFGYGEQNLVSSRQEFSERQAPTTFGGLNLWGLPTDLNFDHHTQVNSPLFPWINSFTQLCFPTCLAGF